MNILVINGPNLNLLGIREPDIYGKKTYNDLVNMIKAHCDEINKLNKLNSGNILPGVNSLDAGAMTGNKINVSFYQSNHEGDLVDAIGNAYFNHTDGIIINPGAYTHTSIALLDAVKAVGIPTVEVHISDVNAREDFRKISYISLAAVKTITGHGFNGYTEAVDFLVSYVGNR